MHTLWKGSISFGLVNVPVKMHAATETHEFHFNYLHKDCNNRIRYIKKCPRCEVEVAAENIVKGYEYEKDQYVIMGEEDLATLEAPMSRSIDILDFINLSDIDPIYYQKSYYLSPEETAQKAYKLLCQAMSDTGKVAIAKLTMRSKQHLACLRVIDENIMVLETMYYPAEIRHLESSWDNVSPTETEIAMARQLIENLAAPFAPEKYRDELREQVKELIEKKVAGETFRVTAAPEPGKVIDLMEALRASIAMTDEKRGRREEEEKETNVPLEHEKAKGKGKDTPKKSRSMKKTADAETIEGQENEKTTSKKRGRAKNQEEKKAIGDDTLDQEVSSQELEGKEPKSTLTMRKRRKAKGA